MTSAMDKLKEHTAALEAVAGAARDIQQELSQVRAELPPTAEKLRELNAEIERHWQHAWGSTFRWALIGGVLGGFAAGLVSRLKPRSGRPPAGARARGLKV